jgi:hypothetical protein
VQISGTGSPFKMVSWSYPYKKLALGSEQYPGFLHCKQFNQTEDQLYSQSLASIMNGNRAKYLYDCKRGLEGLLSNEDDDPAKAITIFVPKGSKASTYYLSACLAVTHEAPYMPE